MSIDNSLKTLFASIALLVTSATLLHDTKLDKAYATAVPVAASIYSPTNGVQGRIDQSNVDHTHIERTTFSRASSEGTPRIQPRDDRKHYTPRYLSRDNSNFGASGVIWPSV